MIVWNPQYSNFATFNPHASEVWLNLIHENLDREQLYQAPRIHLLFRRLFSERKLQSYVNPSRHIFFNLQLFNPRIYIDPRNFQRVFEYRSIPTQRVPNIRLIYQFRDCFPAYCIIQELNLERQEIVYYWYYTRDFISEDIRDSDDFESREYDFFILPLLQYLWSTRLALSSLTRQYLEDFFIEHLFDTIYQSEYDSCFGECNFSNYHLRLETLERTYTERDINFAPQFNCISIVESIFS